MTNPIVLTLCASEVSRIISSTSPAPSKATQNTTALIFRNAFKRDADANVKALAVLFANPPGIQIASTLANLLTGLASNTEGAIDRKAKRDLEGDAESLLDRVEEYP
ncbi:hypothetical protein EDD17DRAFT_1756336 [Pisolithus thermaeus]|nr:hypothetical protein EDD17DRAFT_1756336 [Pisolithus thermaeus]